LDMTWRLGLEDVLESWNKQALRNRHEAKKSTT